MRLLLALCTVAVMGNASACDEDSAPVFSCQAADGRKFIELCSSTPVRESGSMQYRFGSLDKEGREKTVELVYPTAKPGSMKQFFGATYTHKGVYTQSIRFASGQYSYT